MTDVATFASLTLSRGSIAAWSERRGEPDWLRDLRLAAWDAYEASPWPGIKDPGWTRIDLTKLNLNEYQFGVEPGYTAAARTDLPKAVQDAAGEGGGLIVQDGASVVYHDSDVPAGVIFTSLEEAVISHPDLVRKHLGTVVTSDDSKFAALHLAIMSGGTFVYVPKGVVVEQPLRSVHWISGSAGITPHTLLVVEEGASVTYIDDSVSEADATGIGIGGVEVIAGDNTDVRYIGLQEWGPQVLAFDTLRSKSGKDTNMKWLTVVLGGKQTRASIDAEMPKPGANTEMLGVYFGDETQKFDIHTLQGHHAPHTTSDLLFKGVLRDTANSLFSGLIQVAPGAQHTDAYQANRNLLLSPKARADSLPGLEIEANDVRCTHGSTAGPIDFDQVFYLQARGIPRVEAEKVIVEGFLEPVVSRIPLESVRDRIDRTIAAKMR